MLLIILYILAGILGIILFWVIFRVIASAHRCVIRNRAFASIKSEVEIYNLIATSRKQLSLSPYQTTRRWRSAFVPDKIANESIIEDAISSYTEKTQRLFVGTIIFTDHNMEDALAKLEIDIDNALLLKSQLGGDLRYFLDKFERNKSETLLAEFKKLSKLQITKTCPSCGSRLVVRNGKHGKFWGCKGYPACRYTQDYTTTVRDAQIREAQHELIRKAILDEIREKRIERRQLVAEHFKVNIQRAYR